MNAAVVQPAPATSTPVDEFSDCHRGLLLGMRAFGSLPELAAAAARSRAVAVNTLALFDKAVLTHHADEEKELFPAVLASCSPAERKRLEIVIERLIAEHRSVEALWRVLKPAVKRAASGIAAELDAEAVTALVVAYNRHAAYEEAEFLPAAKHILSRNGNHMSALGLSLHLRHAPQPVGYI
jgi:hypothetical protein